MAVAKTIPAPAALVDELGDLEKELAPWQLKIARVEQLRKSIRASYEQAPANQCQTAEGTRFIAMLGARASVATVSIPKLVKTIGSKAALAIVSCSLKALAAHCGIEGLVVTRANTGSRSLQIFEKGSPA